MSDEKLLSETTEEELIKERDALRALNKSNADVHLQTIKFFQFIIGELVDALRPFAEEDKFSLWTIEDVKRAGALVERYGKKDNTKDIKTLLKEFK